MVLETKHGRIVREHKLTAVSIGYRGKQHHFFLRLPYDEQGRAHVPQAQLDRILDGLGVQRGCTYTVG